MIFQRVARVCAVVLMASAAVGPAFAAEPADVADYLNEIDDMWRGKSSKATVAMNVKTAHYSRSMKMRVWSKGKEKSLIRIERPLKEKGTATLKSKDNIYTYLPKTDRTVRLSSGMMMGSWMGSHFTNDDLVKNSRLLDDFTAQVVAQRTVDGRRHVEIQLTPKEDAAVVWGKIITTFDTELRVPVKHVYYDEDGEVVRTMVFSNSKKVEGKLRPMKLRVIPADSPNEYTEIIYEKISFDEDIADSFFSLGRLKRR
jgi:outer membrane lipoprotein-sorting protein